jgi:hypothetical protein
MREDQRKGILPIHEKMLNWRAHKRKWANVVWLLKNVEFTDCSMDSLIKCGRESDPGYCSACTEDVIRRSGVCCGCPIQWVDGVTNSTCTDDRSLFMLFLEAYHKKDIEQSITLARKIRDIKWKPRERRIQCIRKQK